MSSVEIQGEITERDYLRAHWLHMKPRRRYRIVAYAVLGLFGIASVLAIATAVSGREPASALYLFAAVLFILALGALHRYMLRRTYRAQPSLQGTHRYVFSASGFSAESPHGKGEAAWEVFTKWREDSNLFLLYQATNLFHMLPKRWFENGESALSEFRSLLRSHSLERVE